MSHANSRPRRSRPSCAAAHNAASRAGLQLVSGYTVLVLDTNILLSSLAMVTRLVESFSWTVVVPLPAIMELDGLASNPTPLGEAAKAAIAFVVGHVRSHADALKVQTSRGNYLSSLTVRSELVDFDDPDSWERNMDDLILKAAIWQDEHWVDRSAFLKVEQSSERTKGAAKVVLLSLDRNRAYLAFFPFRLLSDPLLLHQFVSKHVRDTWTLPVKRNSLFCWPRRTDGNDRSSSAWSSRQWCCASVLGQA